MKRIKKLAARKYFLAPANLERKRLTKGRLMSRQASKGWELEFLDQRSTCRLTFPYIS